MNISTFSNKTIPVNDTNANISEEAIDIECYRDLKRQYETLSTSHEKLKQEFYDVKRAYDAAVDAQVFLNSELECYHSQDKKMREEWGSKIQYLQDEMQELNQKHAKDTESYSCNLEKLQRKILELEDKVLVKESEVSLIRHQNLENVNTNECVTLRKENMCLQEVIDEHKTTLKESSAVILNLQEQLVNLNEELQCMRTNLMGKRDELKVTTELLQSTQEELASTNLELMKYKTDSNIHASKGNSLFAEVEDKRQEMAKKLVHMKQQNMQLKRDLANKQNEIDALLSEKKMLWDEYSGLAGHHDEQLMNAFEKRITDLEQTVELQRRDLTRWFNKYYDANSPDTAKWIGAALAHSQERITQLSDDLTSSSVECLSKATQIRELQRQVTTWRLKCLDSSSAVTQLQRELQELRTQSSVEEKEDVNVKVKPVNGTEPSKGDKRTLVNKKKLQFAQ